MADNADRAGGIVIHDGRVLLVRHRSKGEVRIPKGHIDPGESPEKAALREVAEETGYHGLEITADLGDLDNEFVVDGITVQRHERFYLMRLTSPGQSPRSEHDEERFEVLWIPLAEAERMLTFEDEREFLRWAVARL